MPLPININDLLRKQKIESNCIEFKKGWKPDTIYHAICAFANGFDNIGGGYILVGVEKENGQAKRLITGIPTFQDELAKNGLPRATIETDESRSFFLIDIPVHEGFGSVVELHEDSVNAGVNVSQQEHDILDFCKLPRSRRDIFTHIGVIYHSKNYKRFIEPLIELGLLELTIPDKPKSPNQKFKLTDKGNNALSPNKE